jgi:hypothetical protein
MASNYYKFYKFIEILKQQTDEEIIGLGTALVFGLLTELKKASSLIWTCFF